MEKQCLFDLGNKSIDASNLLLYFCSNAIGERYPEGIPRNYARILRKHETIRERNGRRRKRQGGRQTDRQATRKACRKTR